MLRSPFLSLGPLLILLACAGSQSDAHRRPDPSGPAWGAPAIESAVSVRDGRTGSELSLDQLLERLAAAEMVFLGETHIDETTHRTELAIFEGLLARREGQVVLALEMFQRDAQEALDAYGSGAITEDEFLSRSNPWQQYRTAYRPLVELARRRGSPVVGSNFPRSLLREVARGGAEAYEKQKRATPDLVPQELFPNSADYHRRTDNAIRGHLGMMSRSADDQERLYETQTLWDNAMGEACVRALEDHPGSTVLHVNGYFHSSYWDGTVRQVLLRRPQTKVLTVTVLPSANPSTAQVRGKPAADYIVFAERRASDRNDGTWSVHVQREQEYRFHLPEGASESNPVPLVIWLSDEGIQAEEGLALWRDRLGEECALAVLETPYRAVEEDLADGGRWFWNDSFSEDIGAMVATVERVWGYLLRNFPIAAERVCIAGEGSGATVVAATTLLTQRMSTRAVAHNPRRYTKIRDFPLPLPMDRGTEQQPEKSLALWLEPEDRSWWERELADYETIGFDAHTEDIATDPWQRDWQLESALRSVLALPSLPDPAGSQRRYLLVEGGGAREFFWSRLEALRESAASDSPVAVVRSTPDGFPGAQPFRPVVQPETLESLPRCPGPFGGTTIVVLAETATEVEREAWQALQDRDPLAAKSRFHRMNLAIQGTEQDLEAVLRQLLERGRRNALIIPATFYAGPETMRTLENEVLDLADRMSLHWRPGMGGP